MVANTPRKLWHFWLPIKAYWPTVVNCMCCMCSLPPRVKTVAGRDMVSSYHSNEAEKVLAPIRKFLQRHPITFQADWVVGNPADDIIKASKSGKAHLIVMGTHGHGVLGRILLGSVAQRVVSNCDVPILLVK
jgi:nucleotide-binding universal stress UspA family protein